MGGGVWGRAFAFALAGSSASIIFWDRDQDCARQAAAFCGGAVAAEAELPAALQEADLIVIAVNSGAFAEVAERAAAASSAPFVWLTKGFEPATARPLSAVAADIRPAGNYAAVSGPSFAAEVAAGKPAALAIAAPRRATGEQLREILFRKNLRLYLEDDITGVCVGGAVKNIIAIAAGICDGMELGENARAALVTRGLAEMGDICEALGGKRETLLGLAGVGDLTLTCASDQSRNRQLGLALGKNAAHCHAAADIRRLAAKTCEGAAAVLPVLQAIAPHNLQTPITRAVAAVLRGEASPAAMADKLLSRPPAAA